MVEVGQIAVDENGKKLTIVSIVFNTVDYFITVGYEQEYGPDIIMPYIEADFNEKHGNLTWTTP